MSSSRLSSGKRTSSPALRALSWLAPALFALFLSKPAAAYPWMIKHGYSSCSTCHADPSGGELLTVYGRVMSDAFLSMQWKSEESASRAPRLRLALPVAARSKNAMPRPKLPLLAPFAQVAPEEAPAEAPDAPTPEEAPAPDDNTAVEPTEPADNAAPGDAAPEPPAPSEPPVSEPAATAPAPPPEPESEPELPATEPELETEPATVESESSEPGLPFYEAFFGLFPLPERLLLGGSIRLASTYKPEADEDQLKFFPMQLDLYGELSIAAGFGVGGSLGVAKVPAGSPNARAAQITSDQGDGYNLISRTHYLRYDFGEGSYTVRAGRLNLPFGIRMSEHVMWVREQTQTDRESDQQTGIALAMGFEQLRFEVMAIAGNYQIEPDSYRERGYSGYVEYAAWDKGALGVSTLLTIAGDDRLNPVHEDTTRQAHGVFARVAIGDLAVLMLEGDVLLRSRRDMGYVGFAQLDVEPVRGLHFIGTGEVLDSGYPDDADARAPGAGEANLRAWLRAPPGRAKPSSEVGSARSGSSLHTSISAWTASSDKKSPFNCWASSTSTSEVVMSNRTSPRLHKLFGAVVALGLSAAAAPSAASSTYPEAIAEHLDPPCIPQCTTCHRDNVGGRKTVDKPFGLAMMELGLRFAAPQRIPDLLDQLEEAGVDSDGDGAGDVVELRSGQDPNGDEDLCGLGVKYGCFNRVAGGAPSEGGGLAALGFLSFSLALVMRRRRTRARANERE